MDAGFMDQATAAAALRKAAAELKAAVSEADSATETVVDLIMSVRPQGLLTVDEMANAIGRDRNYVDSLWALKGGTVKGKQTRIPVTSDGAAARKAYDVLSAAAQHQRKAANAIPALRAERNRVVVMVYVSRLLGPSAIAEAVGIDRNHVGRIARKAGIKPIHRRDSRNQYTKVVDSETAAA